MAGALSRPALLALVAVVTLSGCATGELRLARALDAGRWDEAAQVYEQRLAENPDRLDARVGLGIVRYKLGSWDEAVAALEPAVARAPNLADARLYLGLAHLQRDDVARADAELAAYRGLVRDARLAAQTDQALGLLRGESSPEARRFVAASLEIEAVLARDAERARRYALEHAYWGPYWGPYWGSAFWGYGPCWPYWRGGRFPCW
jgi:tetratricopeptide (TPR) repeat protein